MKSWRRNRSTLSQAALTTEAGSAPSPLLSLVTVRSHLPPALALVGTGKPMKALTWLKPHLTEMSNAGLDQFPASTRDVSAQTGAL